MRTGPESCCARSERASSGCWRTRARRSRRTSPTSRRSATQVDAAQTLRAEGVDEAFAADLADRLAALDRAEERLNDGTYGRSVLSGEPLPDERLEADPAAELTVEEAEGER